MKYESTIKKGDYVIFVKNNKVDYYHIENDIKGNFDNIGTVLDLKIDEEDCYWHEQEKLVYYDFLIETIDGKKIECYSKFDSVVKIDDFIKNINEEIYKQQLRVEKLNNIALELVQYKSELRRINYV